MFFGFMSKSFPKEKLENTIITFLIFINKQNHGIATNSLQAKTVVWNCPRRLSQTITKIIEKAYGDDDNRGFLFLHESDCRINYLRQSHPHTNVHRGNTRHMVGVMYIVNIKV